MGATDVIRAWKDERYRGSLSSEEQALLPENPVGQIELDLPELHQVNGGEHTFYWFTAGCCNTIYCNPYTATYDNSSACTSCTCSTGI